MTRTKKWERGSREYFRNKLREEERIRKEIVKEPVTFDQSVAETFERDFGRPMNPEDYQTIIEIRRREEIAKQRSMEERMRQDMEERLFYGSPGQTLPKR